MVSRSRRAPLQRDASVSVMRHLPKRAIVSGPSRRSGTQRATGMPCAYDLDQEVILVIPHTETNGCKTVHCSECSLSSHRFMAALGSESLSRIEENRLELQFRRGSILFRQGEPAERMYCLVDALVKLTRESPGGRKTIVGIEKGGSLIGLSGVFGSGRYPYTAEVITAGRCCEVRSSLVIQAAERSAQFSRQLLDLVSRENERTAGQMGLATGPKLAPKLACLLLRLAKPSCGEEGGEPGGNGATATVEGLTRQDLARLCAVSNEALVRCLTTFRNEGVVEAEGRTIKILDPARLERLGRMA